MSREFTGLQRSSPYTRVLSRVNSVRCDNWTVHVCKSAAFTREDVSILRSAARQFGGVDTNQRVLTEALNISNTRSSRPVRNRRGMIPVQYLNCRALCFPTQRKAMLFAHHLSYRYLGRFTTNILSSSEHEPSYMYDPPYMQEVTHLSENLSALREQHIQNNYNESSGSETDSSVNSNDVFDPSDDDSSDGMPMKRRYFDLDRDDDDENSF